MDKIKILKELIEEVSSLKFNDDNSLDAFWKKGRMILRRLFGEKNEYLDAFTGITFHPYVYPASNQTLMSCWYQGQAETKNLLNTIIEELETFGDPTIETPVSSEKNVILNEIFIVHGHDNEMKESVARVLEKLGLKPIILHEQTNEGRTIIEKFEESTSNIGYAVVLLSPDDIASPRNNESKKMFRARQNVIFELGYFTGRLGRKAVFVLHKKADSFEMPSDYAGILYTPYDEAGMWKFTLAKELKSKGFNIDLNILA